MIIGLLRSVQMQSHIMATTIAKITQKVCANVRSSKSIISIILPGRGLMKAVSIQPSVGESSNLKKKQRHTIG
jgi:methyl coenzyme M reductase subunit D